MVSHASVAEPAGARDYLFRGRISGGERSRYTTPPDRNDSAIRTVQSQVGRTLATRLAEAGAGYVIVKDVLGHSAVTDVSV